MPFFSTLLATLIGSLGFALLFSVKPNKLLYAVLGGGIAFLVYYLTQQAGCFFSNMLASLATTLWCEIISRVKKAPVVTFLKPSILVLVPGGSLYYTVSALLNKTYDVATARLIETAEACLGIAAGVLLASLLFTVLLSFGKKAKSTN
ncbi:MAG: threonine/serine exporter family protein [Clostridia bacterium]|nr:threonine/serine exporter family protein [Clostridia bacterium]